MYHEDIAQLIADHLNTHIEAYLAEVNARFTVPITLSVPKSIEPASVVGGLMTAFDEILPQYGIDMLSDVFSETSENLYIYEYGGQINGLVHSQSRQSVDQMIWRHASAVELFIRRHQYMHEVSNANFRIVGLYFAGLDFSGAEEISGAENEQVWLAGFSMNFVALLSEDGIGQHAN